MGPGTHIPKTVMVLVLCFVFAAAACGDDDVKKPDGGQTVDLPVNPDLGATAGPARVDGPVQAPGAVVPDGPAPADTSTPQATGKPQGLHPAAQELIAAGISAQVVPPPDGQTNT